jgi:tetratricopeptide (TPR) repeat protein
MPRQIHSTPFIIKPDADLIKKNPELRWLSNLVSIKYADPRQYVTEEDLTNIGSNLWAALNIQRQFELASQAASADILPVIIESDVAEIQALPWETLHHPVHGFIGKNKAFALSRRVRALPKSLGNLRKGPLRFLLFTSLPDDVEPERGRLNVEEEQIQVQESLLSWIGKGLVQLEIPDDGRFSTLQELLESFQPHILYLSGHGKFHHQPHSGEAAYGEFFFESETGNAQGVKEDEIANSLIGSSVQAVVISACESGKVASDELNNGLTRKLSMQGIPHVIGMRESIYDQAGIQFARALCNELAGQERIDVALQSARIAIQKPFAEGQIVRHETAGIRIEELSLGQWCLPVLLSTDVETPLVDWDFTPQSVKTRIAYRKQIDNVSLPARFIGRRKELRQYKNRLLNDDVQKLLLTAPGGQGKTSLVGKLALDLRKNGYMIFAWSAYPKNKNSWTDFVRNMANQLSVENLQKYNNLLSSRLDKDNDSVRANLLLSALTEQYSGKAVLLLDGLDAIQDKSSLAIDDPTIAAWIQTAEALPNLILLVTSRWKPFTWSGEVLQLERANYGDFLQIAQQVGTQPAFLQDRTRLRKIYDVLGGNSRGLELLATTSSSMESLDEKDFLLALEKTKNKLQTNMSIEVIYSHLPKSAQTLLRRLPSFYEPVPKEGILNVAIDIPESENFFQHLLNVSLVEAKYNSKWQMIEYQCVPLVAAWLREHKLTDEDSIWLNVAAEFHQYMHKHIRETTEQAMFTHDALRRAGRHDEADYLALNIVSKLNKPEHFLILLQEWLPVICSSKDLRIKVQGLEKTGELLSHINQYERAIEYYKMSLSIAKEINDKQIEGVITHNIAHVLYSQGKYESALNYLEEALVMAKQSENKRAEGHILHTLGLIFKAQGKPDASSYFTESLEIMKQIDDKKGESAVLYNSMQRTSQFEELEKSLSVARQDRDKQGEAAILTHIAEIYKSQEKLEIALNYSIEALKILRQIGDKRNEGVVLTHIAQIYNDQKDYESAIKYFEKSRDILKQIGNESGLCQVLFHMGGVYSNMQDIEKTADAWVNSYILAKKLDHLHILKELERHIPIDVLELAAQRITSTKGGIDNLEKNLSIIRQSGDKRDEAVVLLDIAEVYYAQKDYENAIKYLGEARDIFKQIDNEFELCRVLFYMGQVYFDIKKIGESNVYRINSYILAKKLDHDYILGKLEKIMPLEDWTLAAKGYVNLVRALGLDSTASLEEIAKLVREELGID